MYISKFVNYSNQRLLSLCIISAYREKFIGWKTPLKILFGKSQYIKSIYQRSENSIYVCFKFSTGNCSEKVIDCQESAPKSPEIAHDEIMDPMVKNVLI